jgi:ribosomal protein S18 acetylase RimI-like enzyme
VRIAAIADAMVYKSVRLRALREDPTAFGSTYAEESRLTDAQWIERLAERGDTARSIVRVAVVDGVACGLVGCFFEADDRAQLVSMWVAPEARGQGIATALVGAVLDWARGRGARAVVLMVTSSNAGALAFYERLGFLRTGRTEPYPNDPALVEYEMARALS